MNFSLNTYKAIWLIRKYFSKTELLTSNFYSVLHYNSETWYLPSLKASQKQKLLSASAKALRTYRKVIDYDQSFISIHSLSKRATPEMLMRYKLALGLYKLYTVNFNSIKFTHLNFNQLLTGRQTMFKTQKKQSLQGRTELVVKQTLLYQW